MTAIAPSSLAARDDLAALLRSNTPASVAPQPAAAEKADAGTAKGDGPAVTVSLSDRAKAMLERNKADQLVADRLDRQLADAKGGGKSGPTPKSTTDDAAKLFDSLSGRSAPQATSDTIWEAGAPYGDPTTSDAQFLKDISFNASLLGTADTLEQQGVFPEIVKNYRDAIANGTFKIQKASEVPDLNFHSEQHFTPSAIGGGYDGWGTSSQNPTGATKEAIDQGKAVAMWSADRGDIYISW